MLAPFHRTLLVDRMGWDVAAVARIGESLPAAAWRLIRDLGLWDDFQRQGHQPCYARCSHWGVYPVVADSVCDADGPGWRLDRARFDAWLRDCVSASKRDPLRVAAIALISHSFGAFELIGDRLSILTPAKNGIVLF